MVFEAAVSVSFVTDAFMVLMYISRPGLFGEEGHIGDRMSPLDSTFLVMLLAGLRSVVFIPYVWRYLKDDLLVLSQRPYLWHSFNVCVIVFKAISELIRRKDSQNFYVWLALVGSILSIYCQALALKSLVSTALPERHLVLGVSQPHSENKRNAATNEDHLDLKPASSTDRRSSKSSDRLLAGRVASYYTGTPSLHHHPQVSGDPTNTERRTTAPELLQRMRERLDAAHNEWNLKIVKLKESIASFGSDSKSLMRPDAVVFEELLMLFVTNKCHAHIDTAGLDKINCQQKKIDDFSSEYLEEGLSSKLNPSGVTSTTPLEDDSKSTTLVFLSLFEQYPEVMEFHIPQLVVYMLYGHATTSAEVKEALLQICKKSAVFALKLSYFIKAFCLSEAGINADGVVVLNQLLGTIESLAVSQSDLVCYGEAQRREEDSAIAGKKDHAVSRSYPFALARQLPSTCNSFSVTVSFWDSLLSLSRALVEFSKRERNAELRTRLPEICREYLPSSCIYAPVGNVHHRIWSIVAEECFAFSTKTRAPMFLCLEIVDFDVPKTPRRCLRSAQRVGWVTGLRRVVGEVGEALSFTTAGDRQRHPPAPHPLQRSLSDGFEGRPDSEMGQWCQLHRHKSVGSASEPGEKSSGRVQSSPPDAKTTSSADSLDPSSCFSPTLCQAAEPLVVFKERWRDKEKRVRACSEVGNLPGYRLLPVILKSNDDLRQEEIAAQLLFLMHQILIEGEVQCWLRPYSIVAMTPDSGIIEAIPDTVSMDVLRRRVPNFKSLRIFFENFFGEEGSAGFERARRNFVESLAPYCIVCYILNLKDRHNGNILLDRKGHVIHIDFGFIFGLSPGGNMGFESAPFKLTNDFVELMGGPQSETFQHFRALCVETFMQLRKHHYRIALLLEMISIGNEHLPCFNWNSGRVIDEMRNRFKPNVHDRAAIAHVHKLIDLSIDNWTTTCYDKYQKCFVGVF